MTDDVTRIGRGVPTPPKPKRWFGIKPEFVIAAAVVIAVAMMVTAVYTFDPPTDNSGAAPSQAPAAIVVQCMGIRHEFETWSRGKAELDRLPQLNQGDARYYVKHLDESAAAFGKASSGYEDRASKELAVAVAAYRVELGFIGIDLQLGPGKVDPDKHAKTREAWAATEKAYQSFATSECRSAFAVQG